uniref:C. elegans SRG-34 protein (Corresponding sequence Y51A2D.12) n=1 Tax=Neisseria meningitidis alpha275 TaxID=295996 RepID=C6SNF4_NEIME|nr:C. elegans SRG-34 protein (corresponding sequence Y51A2D.12) [Neisseria meningitidis alpha275]
MGIFYVMPSENMRRQTDLRQNNKIKKQCGRRNRLILCLKNFQTAFFSEQNRIFFIHSLPKACPPPEER